MLTGNTRAAAKQTLNYPKHKTTLYERSPLYRSIITWNNLPTPLRTTTASTFKKEVQKYKINSSYGRKEAKE